ncbi:unnamed protein product [Rotaria magnacalcarata]|uniref:Uncharacterized protein n=1 Tax=Rotaria magnacalcarata TaxID=392030 RepID=A0A816BPC2_9BILA|nr:unnamed protein product [Rotaria magnacalcarata]CAF1610244.1 unnamed protein product [Rotaria magnacalcarata]CAF4072734.1 unnamed protein product [Rotaria magnacalcarata]CAF4112745.1 unnamed protein product [Rotaria magnacalcarata]
MSSSKSALEWNSSVSLNYRQSLPENPFITNTHTNALTQSRSVPHVGKSNWGASQTQPINLISTSRKSISKPPEITLLNDTTFQQSFWNDAQIQSSNSLISGSSNWDPIKFSSLSNTSYRKSVCNEAWVDSHNITSTRKNSENNNNLNRNRSYSNNATVKLDQLAEIEAGGPELDSVNSDPKLATQWMSSRQKMSSFYIIATCIFISIVVGTALGIFIHVPTEAATSTQTSETCDFYLINFIKFNILYEKLQQLLQQPQPLQQQPALQARALVQVQQAPPVLPVLQAPRVQPALQLQLVLPLPLPLVLPLPLQPVLPLPPALQVPQVQLALQAHPRLALRLVLQVPRVQLALQAHPRLVLRLVLLVPRVQQALLVLPA